MVLLFTFLPWIHLEFNPVYGMMDGPTLLSFPNDYPCPNASK